MDGNEKLARTTSLAGVAAGLVGSLIWFGGTVAIFAAQYTIA